MSDLYYESFVRNIGIFTESEQNTLKNSTIAIAGVGGVGGLLAERLVRLGIGSIKITDLGSFEESNLNRQFGSSIYSLGKQKCQVVFEEVRRINPDAIIIFDDRGIISASDADQFVNDADLVIDEMDYGAWKESIYLQRAARNKGIYYMFSGAIGFGALLANFAPEGITLEEYNNLEPDLDLHASGDLAVGMERVLPVIPSYVTDAMSMEMLQEIVNGQRPVPTCSIGVGLASLLAAMNAINILLRRKDVIKAPEYIYLDLLDLNYSTGIV